MGVRSLRISTEAEVEGDDFTLRADFALATMEEEDGDDVGFSTGGVETILVSAASEDV